MLKDEPIGRSGALRKVALSAAFVVGTLGLTANAAGAAAAQVVVCGSVVTTDVVLDHDLFDCPEDGLIVGASGIRIDLRGHTVDGDGADDDPVDAGIEVGQYDNVEVRNGTVSEFYTGIALTGSTNVEVESMRVEATHTGIAVTSGRFNLVRHLSAVGGFDGIVLSDADDNVIERSSLEEHVSSGVVFINGSDNNRVSRSSFVRNGFTGVTMDGTSANVVIRNHVRESEVGILPFNSSGVLVRRNTADDNEVGIAFFNTRGGSIVRNVVDGSLRDGIQLVEGATGAKLLRNVVTASGDDGIDVDVAGNTLTRNRSDGNLDFGIEALSGTIDGGRNEASGNGAAEQCTGIVCSGP